MPQYKIQAQSQIRTPYLILLLSVSKTQLFSMTSSVSSPILQPQEGDIRRTSNKSILLPPALLGSPNFFLAWIQTDLRADKGSYLMAAPLLRADFSIIYKFTKLFSHIETLQPSLSDRINCNRLPGIPHGLEIENLLRRQSLDKGNNWKVTFMEYQITSKELIEVFHPNMEMNKIKLSSKLKNLCFFIFFSITQIGCISAL